MNGADQLLNFLAAAIRRGNNPSAALQRPISTVIEAERRELTETIRAKRLEEHHMIMRNEVCLHRVTAQGVCIRCGWETHND